ncbi:aminopeptidase P family protein (plasmid) [Pedobacter sp. BS3]|uniref:aminopeptidase P family protein n=1 Tax=Pedobacter sp. BS3 TaxID=2567937 RepID=UPI0011EE666A|nr:aminopeptidase P family protein [Pedobacter sp. BS3]TZF86111.1 aminopeptidase P family protein [Pedobacter sp. BS3]
MKYPYIDNTLFISNRAAFVKHLKNNSIAILNANDEYMRSGDQNFNFKQNADLFYLSGIDQEQTILLLYPDCPNPLYREVLFLRQTNEHIAVWEGHKYTKEEAQRASGIQAIYWLEDFDNILQSIAHYADTIYLNTNENDRSEITVPYRDLRFIRQMKDRFPLHHYERMAPILRGLRAVKSTIEVELTRKACSITRDAFIRVLKFVKPGVKEYEIEAEIIHEFIRQGATGHAYSPIIASGNNAVILHYTDNNQVCKDGDVILFDFAAEYANYNADLSRSIPVNGRFTKRQKDVYNAVHRVMIEAKKLLKPGAVWNEYQDEVGRIMESELIGLGLLDKHDVAKQNPKVPLYKKYFMHGVSHHLGIDVHDFAGRYTPFEAGNILTCEPGIYIREEGLGIRLENDILLTTDGNIDLMADIPLEAEEIEELMNEV